MLEYTTSLEDWILLERRIARLVYKETECGYLPVVLLFCMQSKLFIDSILLRGPDFSGQQEFAGGQGDWIEADLHGKQGRTAGVCWSTYTVSCTSLNLY